MAQYDASPTHRRIVTRWQDTQRVPLDYMPDMEPPARARSGWVFWGLVLLNSAAVLGQGWAVAHSWSWGACGLMLFNSAALWCLLWSRRATP